MRRAKGRGFPDEARLLDEGRVGFRSRLTGACTSEQTVGAERLARASHQAKTAFRMRAIPAAMMRSVSTGRAGRCSGRSRRSALRWFGFASGTGVATGCTKKDRAVHAPGRLMVAGAGFEPAILVMNSGVRCRADGCRPSCPSRRPDSRRFRQSRPLADSADSAGLLCCRRCVLVPVTTATS